VEKMGKQKGKSNKHPTSGNKWGKGREERTHGNLNCGKREWTGGREKCPEQWEGRFWGSPKVRRTSLGSHPCLTAPDTLKKKEAKGVYIRKTAGSFPDMEKKWHWRNQIPHLGYTGGEKPGGGKIKIYLGKICKGGTSVKGCLKGYARQKRKDTSVVSQR